MACECRSPWTARSTPTSLAARPAAAWPWAARRCRWPLVGYLWLPGLVSPSLQRDAIRTAIVERGPVDATISATGVVVPEIEQVITSPVEARVLRVIERAGAKLVAGQPILQLDVSQARLTVDKLSQDLAIKANAQLQKRLSLKKSLIDIEGRDRREGAATGITPSAVAARQAAVERRTVLAGAAEEVRARHHAGGDRAEAAARRTRQRAGSHARRTGRTRPRDRQAARRRSRSAAATRSRLTSRGSRRRPHMGDHRRGSVRQQGPGPGPCGRLHLVPRGCQRLGCSRQAPRHRTASHDPRRRRASRRHGRRDKPDRHQRSDYRRCGPGGAVQLVAAIEPACRCRGRHVAAAA